MKMKFSALLILILLYVLPLQAQTPSDRIADLLEQSDFLELNRQYPLLKDSIPPVQRALSEAVLDVVFNRPAAACKSIEALITNYQSEIGFGNVSNMMLIWGRELMLQSKYGEAADLLKDFINQLAGMRVSPNVYQTHQMQYRVAEALRNIPKTTLIRPDRDCEVPMKIEKAGHGSLMYIPAILNGKETSFIFDTGADVQAFASEKFAEEHGIRILADSIMTGGVFASALSKKGVADSIQVGDIVYLNVIFTIADDKSITGGGMADISDSVNFKLDAVLGREFMDAVGEVQILPRQNKILFPIQRTPLPLFGSNLMNSFGQPYLEAYTNDERLLFHLDTGDVISELSVNYYLKHKDHIEALGNKTSIHLGGFGGAKKVDIYTMPSLPLQVGNTKFEMKDIIVHADSVPFSNKDGVLGMSFINLFDKVTINLREMFIQVE